MGLQLIAEVVGQLRLAQVIDALVKVRAQVPDRPCVGGDRLRLQALQPQAFEVGGVVLLEVWFGCCFHGPVASSNLAGMSLGDEG